MNLNEACLLLNSPALDENLLLGQLSVQNKQVICSILGSIGIHLLSISGQKQLRVDVLQRTITVAGLAKIYMMFNSNPSQSIRRLCGSVLFHLIGDSKELAKYVYDKI